MKGRKPSTLLSVVHIDDVNSFVCGGGVWSWIASEGRASLLLTHSTIICSFFVFLLSHSSPSSFLPFLLSFYARFLLFVSVICPMRDPGAIKPDESVLNVLREIPVGQCRLTEMLNSIYFLQEYFCSFFR